MRIALILSLSAFAAVPAAALDAPAPAESVELSREATLAWAVPVQLSVERDGYEVVVRFDKPLAEEEIARFAAATGPYLADLRWNDDSLVMRPAEGSSIAIDQQARSLSVRFVEDAPVGTATATVTSDADGEIELALARAQADAAAGYPGEARRRLEELAQAHSGDARVQRALADAEAAEGRTRDAAARYLSLAADDPMARRIIGDAGGRVTAGTIYRDGKTFSQWESGIDVNVPVGEGLTAGAGLRHVRTIVESVASATGYLPKVTHNLTIADGNASLRLADAVRITVLASALLDHDVVGAGARLVAGPPEREARLYGSYRMPDFSTAEQAAFGGHMTRIGAGGTFRLTPELVVQGDAVLNRYGLPGGGVRTRTTQVLAGVDVLALRRPLSVQLSYRLDAEYVGRVDLRPNGTPFIPLSDRENHTVQVVMSKSIRNAQVTAAGGWTKDRYGGDGPTASVGALFNVGDAWRIEAGGGVSSISRPVVSGRQYFLRLSISRALGRR